tara:strand:+ start:4310 stop:5866 length:1557 start_codon:yes stop_codon:yes gene_type:complete
MANGLYNGNNATAKGTVSLSVGGSAFAKAKGHTQIFENTQEVDNTDGFINILSVSGTKGTSTVPSIKAFCIYNMGDVAAEVQLVFQEWKNNSNVDDAEAAARYVSILLPAGDFFYLPHGRMIGYNADASAANATAIDNTAPASVMYVDSTADLDHATSATMGSDAAHTTLNLENGHSKFFKVGDLIRIENEICEVTEVGTGADLANSTCTIKRGLFGSTAATHADDVAIRLPFFNMYADFDKFSVSQTDKDGKFKAMNFFGYGRTGDAIADGIQSGSIAIKFYSAGYQELGLSGITASTHSGLAASTAYALNITVDGGSTFANLSFTTDSSNLNFGGRNGVINKIQDALNVQYYTSGNLFEKRVSVGIIGGDIRFTSGQHLSGSAIALAAPSSGTTPFGVGRLPAIGDVEAAVAARLPDDTIYDRATYGASPNKSAFMYDDGQGNLIGAGSGRINYETGEIDFTSLPNAEFVVNLIHKSAHAGGVNADTADGKNTIQSIGARSINTKLNTTIKVIAYN